jgi:hypothetical protein
MGWPSPGLGIGSAILIFGFVEDRRTKSKFKGFRVTCVGGARDAEYLLIEGTSSKKIHISRNEMHHWRYLVDCLLIQMKFLDLLPIMGRLSAIISFPPHVSLKFQAANTSFL